MTNSRLPAATKAAYTAAYDCASILRSWASKR